MWRKSGPPAFQGRRDVSGSVVGPVMNDQPCRSWSEIQKAAPDQCGDKILGWARPFEGSRDLFVVVSTYLAGRGMFGGEPPEKASDAQSMRPGQIEDDRQPADLR